MSRNKRDFPRLHKHSDGINRKRRPDGSCSRCGGFFGGALPPITSRVTISPNLFCLTCGVAYDRRTVPYKHRKVLRGKRRHNSGKTSNAKNKSGRK